VGIDPLKLTEAQLRLINAEDRKFLGKRGRTKAEAFEIEIRKLEREIQSEFVNFCHRHHITIWNPSPVKKSTVQRGLPDFLCWRNGTAVAIEFKIAPRKPEPHQEAKFAEIQSNGNLVFVCTERPGNSAYAEATKIVRKFFNLPADPSETP
jgi:hypothetical protein